jgi:sarcosine oxidase subunit beta
MTDQTIADIVIVGGGVIGSSIAYHLARKAHRVLVIERSQVATEPAASWASAGGVRRQGRHPAEAQLAIEAIERWQTLEQELDADLHYRRGGNLFLAENEAEREQLLVYIHQQHENGFTDVQLLDRQEVHAVVPGLSEHVLAGSYSPRDGQADPARTTRAFAAAARRHGATYWENTSAQALLMDGDRVVGVHTEHGDVLAPHVVLAAGAWSDVLASAIGLRLPIRTQAFQIVLSTPASPNTLSPVVSALNRVLSLKQLPDGAFMLGGGWLGDPTSDRRSYTLRSESVQGNWETACDLLPAVGQQSIARAWCGLEAVSIDELPFIGSIKGVDGLILALGFSGHGFAISPAVGRCVADLILGLPVPELAGLAAERIFAFPEHEIAAFVASET